MSEMKKNPFFSVVVPVYNGEDCIADCVGAILAQSFRDIELIVINDGSSDKTEDILSSIAEKDSRLKAVTVENGGVFRARALGASLATGEYLLYCDDDDTYVDDGVFEKLYEAARDKKHQLIQFGYYKKFNHLRLADNTVKETVEAGREEFFQRDYPFLLSSRNIASRLFVNTVTKLYHRSLYKNAPAPESLERLFMGDDMLLNLYFLKDCASALYLPHIFYLSPRLSGDTNRYRRDEMKNLDIIKRHQWAFLSQWNGRDRRKVERLHHLECAEWLFLHVKNSLGHLPSDEVAGLVDEALALPAFIRAREYFEAHGEDGLCVELLLSGDRRRYLEEAEKRKGGTLKERAVKLLKEKIIYKI